MPEEELDESSVEHLKKDLYRRGEGPQLRPRKVLHERSHADDVSHDWMEDVPIEGLENNAPEDAAAAEEGVPGGPVPYGGEQVAADVPASGVTQRRPRTLKQKKPVVVRTVRTIFFASLIFFVIAIGIAVYVFMYGGNQVTCSKILIDIDGPVSIPSGKELVLDVGITNTNTVPLQESTLVVNYPDGARSVNDSAASLPSSRQEINTIEPDEKVVTSAQAVLYGTEQSEKVIGFELEYSLEGSDQVFTCPAQKVLRLATAPVSLVAEGLEEVSSGQEFELTIRMSSNAEETVPDQRLILDYPYGYRFVRSVPEPSEGQNVWELGDFAPGTDRTVTITGVVSAATEENRVIKLALGEGDEEKSGELLNTLQLVEHPLMITTPFLALDLIVNGSDDDVVAIPFGVGADCTLEWKNTLDYPLHDIEIELVLPAPYIEARSVNTSNGYFRSVDHTIIWTQHTNPFFKTLEPGQDGSLQFSFLTQKPSFSTGALEPTMNLDFTVRARRADASAVQNRLVSQSQRTIQFITDLIFDSRVLYSTGPFQNTGPHPPRVDQETSYTFRWEVKNSTNDIKNMQVIGKLPVYVRWSDISVPQDEDITYNPVTREVIWSLGTLAAGTGGRGPSRSVFFQVAMIPSIVQLNSELPLIENVVARGVDSLTGSVVEQVILKQTMRLENDPLFPKDLGKVIQ